MRALLEEQMIVRLHDIYAMEANLQRLLDEMIEKTDDPQLRDKLEQHAHETHHHEQRLVERLQAHGERTRANAEQPADDRMLIDGSTTAIDEQGDLVARDSLIAARVKIAFYEQLERTARRVGDKQTAQVARRNREEERSLTKTMSAVRARGAPK
jgi:ferritin-like metal-binding protein YciE